MAAIELGVFLHCGDLGAFGAELLQQLFANVGVRHFASAEADGDLHAVAILEELLCVFQLDVEVVDVDARRHANLFDLNHMLVLTGFFFFFGLFEAELAIVHDFAHGRSGVGRDLYQIHLVFLGKAQRVGGGHDAQLSTVVANDANLFVANLLVELMVQLTDGKHLQIQSTKCGCHNGTRTDKHTNRPKPGWRISTSSHRSLR